MNFTETLPVEFLLQTHPDYDTDYVKRLKMYFDGGKNFNPESKYENGAGNTMPELRPKPIESAPGENALVGQAIRTARVSCADYTNYFGDTILSLASTLCKCPLLIQHRKKDTEKTEDYWEKLTCNADGKFGTATQQTWSAVIDDLLYNRAFYIMSFPPADTANLQAQAKSGGLDARIAPFPSYKINDWLPDPRGGLQWARSYECEDIRSQEYGPFDKERHTWTYYATDAIYVYVAEIEKDKNGKWDKGAIATRQEPIPHDLKCCPIFLVEHNFDCWIGDKILPTAHKLYNEESDASYYRMATITGGMFIFSDDPAKWKTLQLSPFGAPIGSKEDRVERDKCDAGALEALEKGCAATRGQMGGLIHQMAVQMASQSASGQNTSRASGESIKEHKDPINAMLVRYGDGHIATWMQMIAAAGAIRNEDVSDVYVSGLISPDDGNESLFTQDRMAAETAFAEHPYVPDSAKEARGRKIGLEANEGAEESIIDDIKTEKIEPPEPQVVQMPNKPQGIDAA